MSKIAKTSRTHPDRPDVPRPTEGTENPFAVSTELTEQRGVFGDASRRRRSALLYREIEFRSPFTGRFVYSGWWFRQKIEINGETVWFRISWMQIFRHATFTIPLAIASPHAEDAPPSDAAPLGGTTPSLALGTDADQLATDPPAASRGTGSEIPGRVEIDFTRGLMIRRFRLWIADELVYDEIN